MEQTLKKQTALKMIDTLEAALDEREMGLNVLDLTSTSHLLHSIDLIDPSGELRCEDFWDGSWGYALKFGDFGSFEFMNAQRECGDEALKLLRLRSMDYMALIETKGDVTFYQNEEGAIFQELFENGEVEPVAEGPIQYRNIEIDSDYLIRYELNGINGFSVWFTSQDKLADNFWSLEEVRDYILLTLPRYCDSCEKPVYFEQSPEWEICPHCEETFCADCMDFSCQLKPYPICKACALELGSK